MPSLGEGLGRGFRRVWEGLLSAAVFVPAKAGLFERPKAAFFTVAADGVMHSMTVGMAETTRRKTRFPTVGTASPTKAKPPSSATAFCIYSITLIDAIKVEKHVIDPIQAAATQSRRSPARLREKWRGKYHRLAPPSHYIHPQTSHPHRNLHQAESPPTSR